MTTENPGVKPGDKVPGPAPTKPAQPLRKPAADKPAGTVGAMTTETVKP